MLTIAVVELDNKIEDMEDDDEEAEKAAATPPSEKNEASEDFMSESIYQKLPTPSPRSRKVRSISMSLYLLFRQGFHIRALFSQRLSMV
jgi:mitochondrial division protein 1